MKLQRPAWAGSHVTRFCSTTTTTITVSLLHRGRKQPDLDVWVLLNDSQVEFNIWILTSRFDLKWIFFALDKRGSWKLFNPGSLVAQKEEDWVTCWTGDMWEPRIHTQHMLGGIYDNKRL